MNLEMITEGLKQLLQENNYSSATIRFYESEWNKILCFLTEEYGNTEYDMERGLKYLEKQYGFITKYNDGTLSQQRVQLLRVVHMLEDYRLHQVLTRRYHIRIIRISWIQRNCRQVQPDIIKGFPGVLWTISSSERLELQKISQWMFVILI